MQRRPNGYLVLEERELQILAGYSNGDKQETIAKTVGTTKGYLGKLAVQLHFKLGACDRAHAVAIAYDLGILEPRGGES